MKLVPAEQFSLAELAAAFNQARADYLVPMSTDENHLAAYIHLYDIRLEHSLAAVEGKEMLGLAMLGLRPGRTWLTRLGVLPNQRRRGTGEVLVRALLENSQKLGCGTSILEVIQGNRAAQALFVKAGFHETRELLILRRKPGAAPVQAVERAAWFDKTDALQRLRSCTSRQPWTNEVDTYRNAENVAGLEVVTGSGDRGWVVFQHHSLRLSHFTLHTEAGNAHALGLALGGQLYRRFSSEETYIENITRDDPHRDALMELGFEEVFRRMEMVRVEDTGS